MITVWISASLLAITGWQGYRLGKEYGWWGGMVSPPKQPDNGNVAPPTESAPTGLGQSKTDFGRLLTGYKATDGPHDDRTNTITTPPQQDEQFITEPATTLFQMNEDEYPSETDQVPETCTWMDDEAMLLVDEIGEMTNAEPTVELTDYVQRVRTVQRKMTQLTKRRAADNTFMKQELSILIDTYQLGNDQSLDWLFETHKQPDQPDYGALFDKIESLCA